MAFHNPERSIDTLDPRDSEKRAFFAKKLEEYAVRMQETWYPYRATDALYKHALVTQLLEDGFLDFGKIRTQLVSELGDKFNPRIFMKAVDVIEMYLMADLRGHSFLVPLSSEEAESQDEIR